MQQITFMCRCILSVLSVITLIGCGRQPAREEATPPATTISMTTNTPSEPLPPATYSAEVASVAPSSNRCRVTPANGLRLRAGPGTTFDTRGSLDQGEEFTPHGRNEAGDWILASSDGERELWVAAAFLTCTISLAALPIITPQQLPDRQTAAPSIPTGVVEEQLTPFVAPTATAAVGESPLKRRDVPSGAVIEHLDYFAGGAGYAYDPTGQPRIEFLGVQPSMVEVISSFAIVFEGFELKPGLDAQITRPDGRVVHQHIDSMFGQLSWDWTVMPDDPIGDYQILAVQDERQATGSFTVRPASRPRMLSLVRVGPPGTEFRFALVGYPPGQMVPVYLYYLLNDPSCGGNGFCWKYATTLDSVEINVQGEAIYTVQTQGDDPEGRYGLDTEPRVLLDLGPEPALSVFGGGTFSIQR